jgi:hypothetical protein
MNLRIPSLTATFLLCAGCASSAPNPKAESSASAIRAAEEVGATHTPDAALHLQLAKEELEYARHLPNSNEKDHVERLLRRAQVDAELALALARSETDKAEALAAIDQVRKLNASAPQ